MRSPMAGRPCPLHPSPDPLAIATTFERRETEIPTEVPDTLTPAFAGDGQQQRQWNPFSENAAPHPDSLADGIAGVAGLIMLHAIAAAKIGRSR